MSDYLDELLRRAERRSDAFQMYIEGYGQRVEDEKDQSRAFHDLESFDEHLRENFEEQWREMHPEPDEIEEEEP